MKIRIITALPIALASAAIFYASSIPSIDLPKLGIWETDKILHFGAYFVYGVLMQIFIIGNFKFSKIISIILTIGLGLAFAMSDEFHQSFVPGRMADMYDFIADAIGILFSISLYDMIEKYCKRLREIIS